MRSGAAALAALVLCGGAGCRTALPRSREAEALLAALEQVLKDGDDNDPRLEIEFEGLSEAAKRKFRERYRSLPRESRNQRGTVVYLLGRNLSRARDFDFLREVAAEAPCLSLADCGRSAPRGGAGDEVTLAYPSLVALRQAALAGAGGRFEREAGRVLAAGKSSASPAVARAAARLESARR